MKNNGRERNLKPLVIYGGGGIAVAALVVGFAAFVVPQRAAALPAYAQQTGSACGRCHVNPAGGGALTGFGKAFAANGHKMPSGAKSGKSGGGKGAATAAPAAPAGPPIVVYNYAQAGAWSLWHPYYTHFLYSPDDYRH